MRKMEIMFVGAGLMASTAIAGVTFQYNYTDAGVGFNDPTHGAARRAALADAGNYVSGLFVNYNATIQLDVDGSASGGFLAAAGANYNAPYPGKGFGDRGDVMVKILGGADPNAGAADGTVTWNFTDYQWELGTDFQAGEYDFFSTAVHEMLHAVGFSSGILQNGDSVWGDTPGNPGTWSPFDEHVADSFGYLIDGSYALDGNAWDTASVGGSGVNGLMWLGANAMAANGGNPVYLYSPTTWEGGSSGSHLDDEFYGGTYIMEAATGTGLGIREISDVEVGMFKDMGYTQIIPEPNTLVLVGLASGIFVFMRRLRIG